MIECAAAAQLNFFEALPKSFVTEALRKFFIANRSWLWTSELDRGFVKTANNSVLSFEFFQVSGTSEVSTMTAANPLEATMRSLQLLLLWSHTAGIVPYY